MLPPLFQVDEWRQYALYVTSVSRQRPKPSILLNLCSVFMITVVVVLGTHSKVQACLSCVYKLSKPIYSRPTWLAVLDIGALQVTSLL